MIPAPNPGTALVTGASTGIGAVYADRLAKRGHDLILVARSQDRLRALADSIRNRTQRNVQVIAADLNEASDLARVEDVLRTDPLITMLVNNAGFGASSPLLSSDLARMDEMIRLNVLALTRLTYAAVPGLVVRGGGTLINIASIVGIATERLNGVYAASKAFVLAFSQSVHHELSGEGLRVQAVLPGVTATPFWEIAGVGVHNFPASILMSAEDMVDASLAGLDQGEVVTIPALADLDEWTRYDAARREMSTRLSSSSPATRYGIAPKTANESNPIATGK